MQRCLKLKIKYLTTNKTNIRYSFNSLFKNIIQIMKKFLVVITMILTVFDVEAQRVLTLDSCRNLALQNAEDLQKSVNAQKISDYTLTNAKAAALPTLDASGNLLVMFHNIDVMGSEMVLKGVYTAGINLTQPLFTGGKIYNGVKMAQAGRQASEIQQRMTRAEVLAELDKAYYSCIAVDAKVKMLDAYQKQMQHLENVVKTSLEAEMSTELELLRITSKKSEIDYNLKKAQNGLTLCKMALANFIGANMDEDFILADTIIAVNPPQELSEDLSQRPEIQLLEKQIEVREREIKMQRAESLPLLALSAGYTYCGNIKMEGSAQGPDGNYYPYTQKFDQGMTMVMLTAQIPLWHWGSNRRNVKKATLELEDARLDLQKNTKLMSIEARQAVQNLTDGYSMVLTAQLGFQEAQKTLFSMTQKYENQYCTLTDLIDAQSLWQQSFSNLIEAQTQYKIYETEYLRVTGRL